jgi:hypothetical protein
MNWNLNSGYGSHLANAIMCAGQSGKIFIVGASGVAYRDQISQLFQGDADGKLRFSATIAGAVALCTASGNDQILVLPGHTESITGAAGIALSTAGVALRGLGSGSMRPTLTWTTAVGASLDVSAANCTIDNFILDMTGFDAITAGINVTAAGFTLSNCLVINATATNQATLCILTTAAANRMRILNNEFLGTTDAGTATAIRIVGGNEHRIEGNRFYGAYTTSLGAIENNTTACLRVTIKDNIIENATASSTKAMVFAAGSTGSISGNHMQILSGTAPITGAAMSWVGRNYYAATIATAGTLI